jgi:hypothetical protein
VALYRQHLKLPLIGAGFSVLAAVLGSILSILPENTSTEVKEEIAPHLLAAVLEYQHMEHSRFPL